MNLITIMGKLTRDPEVKNTSTQKAFATFTVAVPRGYKDQSGVRPVDYINCVTWERQAGFVSHYFGKGDDILVTGELQSRSYEDSNGNKRTVHEVIAHSIEFCGRHKDDNSKAPSKPLEVPEEVSESLDDADLPFLL